MNRLFASLAARLGQKLGFVAVAIGLSTMLAMTPAAAAPALSSAGGFSNAGPASSAVTKADYVYVRSGRGFRRHAYGGRPYRYGYRRDRGIGTGAAIVGGLLLGTIIANSAPRYRRGYSASDACARDYRSFDWETGTIITYDGHEILCPYLR